jgi:hypothetical protein
MEKIGGWDNREVNRVMWIGAPSSWPRRPGVFDPALLDGDARVHVQDRFKELAAAGATIYGWQVVQKGLGAAGSVALVLGLASPMPPGGAPCQAYPTRSMTGPVPAPPEGGSAGGNRGGYATRHGPGPGFRMKGELGGRLGNLPHEPVAGRCRYSSPVGGEGVG